MKKFILTQVLIAMALMSRAQELQYQKYDWEAKPKQVVITDADTNDHEVGLKDKRILEFAYTTEKHPTLLMYYTRHEIIKVLTQEGIENYNKVYVPMTGALDMVQIKARSISPDGKVIQLAASDIKDANNMGGDQDESTGNYKYFAMQGLEPGSEIEYIYTLKYDAAIYGDEIFQSNFPKRDIEYDLYSPQNLLFISKSYNGLPDMTTDTTLKDERRLFLRVDHIAALKNEDYSSYTSNCGRLEYTLGYNSVVGMNKRVYDWAEAAQAYYPGLTTFDTKTLSDVSAYLKKIDLSGREGKQRIFALDNYIKTHISVKDEDNEDFADVRKILVANLANHTGIMRLYMAVFKQLGIDAQIVLTSDHEVKLFDGDFESWDYLNHFLIYIPSFKVYIAPTEFSSRNGMPPYQWTDNDGLFIKKASVGDYTSGMGSVKYIPPADNTYSHDDLIVDLNFNDSMDAINAHMTRVFTGYNASFVQPGYDFLTDDIKKKLYDVILKDMGDDSKYSNVTVQNNLNDTSRTHPITFVADITLGSLIENAGPKYLFKIGDVIGPQVSLYNTDKRENPVENDYNRGYHREINFTIPDGYKVDNPEALKMNVSMPDSSCFFRANYALDGNKLHILINEEYKRIRYTLAEYADFQNVINASADWNKVVLILEKKT